MARYVHLLGTGPPGLISAIIELHLQEKPFSEVSRTLAYRVQWRWPKGKTPLNASEEFPS